MIDTRICTTCVNYKGNPEQRASSTRPGKMVTITVRRCSVDNGTVVDRMRGMPCPLGLFVAPDQTPESAAGGTASVASPLASEALAATSRPLTLPAASGAVACEPCAKTKAARAAAEARPCANCGGDHVTGKCPIPSEYDGNYQNDSGGDPGCNCA